MRRTTTWVTPSRETSWARHGADCSARLVDVRSERPSRNQSAPSRASTSTTARATSSLSHGSYFPVTANPEPGAKVVTDGGMALSESMVAHAGQLA
ncbi:hypothetical protein GCM10025868_18660 [Angustibacter aerolatus]|uniref:Uncharacterized protein n=1 Tax=Angustibacter aerolatus TaxID=1162965 RepID=A0ABQ6JIL4_9ACTN|nr:hypothetical protein GCM10025868_18660 [Angustibacter aerolatus]